MEARRIVIACTLASFAWALPVTAGAPEVVVTMDWTEGHFHAGLVGLGVGAVDDGDPVPALGVGPVNLQRFDLVSGVCHRTLVADLEYTPSNLTADAPELATLVLPYEFQIELFDGDGERLRFVRTREPRAGVPLGALDEPGPFRIDLYMLTGLDVDWRLRIRAFPTLGEPACRVVINEVEANPSGRDGGAEWLELHNAGDDPLDLAGWRIEALHGRNETLVVPDGTVVPAGGHLVVTFTEGQFLDNRDEVVRLVDPFGIVMDETPALTDTANDDRTWQRVPDAAQAWAFRTGSPGAANGS